MRVRVRVRVEGEGEGEGEGARVRVRWLGCEGRTVHDRRGVAVDDELGGGVDVDRREVIARLGHGLQSEGGVVQPLQPRLGRQPQGAHLVRVRVRVRIWLG